MTDSAQPETLPTPATVTLGTGQAALTTTNIGYGAMSIAGAYGSIAEDAALQLLEHVSESGVNFIDTANIYGDGVSEEIVGKFLTGRREEFVLATKVGIEKGGGVGQRRARGDSAYIKEQIDHSLRRLGTDYVDLYYLHRVDPEVPIEESAGALGELVEAGKVRGIGLSEATGEEIRRAHAVHPLSAVQSEWSIFARDVEVHVLPAVAELGIGFVPYSPVGRGLLTDHFSPDDLAEGDGRHNFPWFQGENLTHNQQLAQKVRQVAAEAGVPTAALALSWLFEKAAGFGATISPIPGTRYAKHWNELQAGLGADGSGGTVSAAALEQLEGLAAEVAGERSFNSGWVSGGREGLVPRP